MSNSTENKIATSTRGEKLSKILEKTRHETHERRFDVFISCKSQDYSLAHELYDFLVSNGFKPFLADTSIKEVGIDQYTALIGDVINVCQDMIVIATDVCYLETPYVAAEWHAFINDINTGHKPNAKIVGILSPEIKVHMLPSWLRDKQCLTTENYKFDLIPFLYSRDDEAIEQLKKEINIAFSLLYHYSGNVAENKKYSYIHNIEQEKSNLERQLEECLLLHSTSYLERKSFIEQLREEIQTTTEKWERELLRLVKENEWKKQNEERAWYEALKDNSAYAFQCYLDEFPHGTHSVEAIERLRNAVTLKADIEAKTYVTTPNQKEDEKEAKSTNLPEGSTLTAAGTVMGGVIGTIIGGVSSLLKLSKQRKNNVFYNVYSSIFAPAEVKLKSHILVQVYLHLYEETEKVRALAQESQKDAERRDYIPLQCKLKIGDKVDVLLNIYGETLLISDKKECGLARFVYEV